MAKKIFIEIPTWLGDAIMATPAVENIIKTYPNTHITLLGSFASIALFENYKNIGKTIINDSKKAKNRYKRLLEIAKEVGNVDVAISFRRSFSSKLMMFFIKAKRKFSYKRLTKKTIHQAVRYNDFVNHSLQVKHKTGDLTLQFVPHKYKNPTLGINPGATYGSAKRWYPKEFASIAVTLSKRCDIVIFGGSGEINIAKDIEDELIKNGVKNYTNLAGKTSIKELCEMIGGLDIFITNDSGPMHIGATYKVKTFAIFGPTNFKETNQWQNPNEHIITKNLSCSPCMKRVCPLGHHNCMKQITAKDVLKEIETYA